jgi:glycosyltransferase involved in cell wall biosynthesis
MWRSFALPMVLLLPRHRQLQIRTLAHHLKLTLWHGEVIDFGDHGSQSLSPLLTPIKPDESVDKPTSAVALDDSVILSTKEVPKAIIPNWAIDEFRVLAQIEPQLYPTPGFIARFHHLALPVDHDSGDIYLACNTLIEAYTPHLIILVPWLVPGGADRGVLHHASAMLSLGKKVLVITTMNIESPWANQLPKDAKFLELGRLASHLSEEQRLAVLTRIVLQSSANVIHIINSQMGWEMVQQHGKALNALSKKIFASLYSEEIGQNGIMHGYPQLYLGQCWVHLHKLICDTRWFPKHLVQRYGVSLEKINTVYFPIHVETTPIYKARGSKNILWAGRFAISKRLDLLIEIAKLLPDIEFDVHGYSINNEELEIEEKLRGLPNVQVSGIFESTDALVGAKDYSLFLYTSAFDGLPNTLLEVTKAGLPVVASAVGGVPEFINEETGYPVADINNPEAYALRIREAIGDDQAKQRKWEAAVAMLLSRHTSKYFIEQLDGIAGYIT